MGGKGSKVAKETDDIYKKYGDQAVKNILAQENSDYQSLSYHNIHQKCHKKTQEIEREGHEIIDQAKKGSEQDYQQIIRDLEKKDPDIVKKAEAASRKQLREIVGVDEQLLKYQNIRQTMVKDFEGAREKLEQSIKRQTRQHQNIDESARYPEYHDQPAEEREKILKTLEDKYGKKWMEQQEKERKEGKLKKQIYQFNFTDNHRPEFQALLPNQKCSVMRKKIKKNFEETIKDSLGTNNICC